MPCTCTCWESVFWLEVSRLAEEKDDCYCRVVVYWFSVRGGE